MRITTSAIIGLAAVGLLAGCSSQSSSSSSAAAGGSSASAAGAADSGSGSSGGGNVTGCPQASTVSTSLGISGLSTQTSKAASSEGHTGYACVYSAGMNIAQVTLVNGVNSSFMNSAAQKARKIHSLQTVSGFADQAYSFSVSEAGVTQNELVSRKGSVEVVVASGATLSKEEALAQSIFTQTGA